MELHLAEHIRFYRKQSGMTQEQLAQIMGVTTGAVYKWESGLSVPDLNLIAEMADFFDISVDALLGYRMRDDRLSSFVHRLNDYARNKDPQAITEAEKALKKYPYSYEVVHCAADVFLIFGTSQDSRHLVQRALKLLEQSLTLISQSPGTEVSELTIYSEMASAYMLLEEYEKGLDILKKHNMSGFFNDQIGITQAFYLNRPDEAEPFLTDALLTGMSCILNSILGLVIVYSSRGDFSQADEIVRWGLSTVTGLKKDDGTGFPEKVMSMLLALQAYTQICTGKRKEAASSVRQAYEKMRRFDAAPDYGLKTLRFTGGITDANAYDILGGSARESLENILNKLGNKELNKLWKEQQKHEPHE